VSVTYIGLIIIPISLTILLLRPALLVPWAIAVSVLQAASVFNVEGSFPIGIAPYFFVTILIATRFIPLWLSGRLGFVANEAVLQYLRLLLLLMLWSVASAFVMPQLFKGVLVDLPRAGMDAASMTPLFWSLSNAAQAGYLCLDCMLVIYMAWQSAERRFVETCVNAFRWSGLFVSTVGIYQLLAHILGLPYPSTFFNSNLARSQSINQHFGEAWRISATFTEPSAAASYFTMWTSFALLYAITVKPAAWRDWALLGCGVVMLMLTTSTTGYVAGTVLVAFFVGREMSSGMLRGVINTKVLFAVVVIVAAFALAILLIPEFQRVLDTVLWRKSASMSGRDRLATDWQALQLTLTTVGLGVGLGSNRPSGLLFYIISDLGLPGFVSFIYLLCVTQHLVKRTILATNNELRCLLRAASWAFAAELLVVSISGAEIASPLVWVSWGLLVATCRYASTYSKPYINEIISSEPILLVNRAN
jgi:hypothetical protein